jgi:carboxyl-terminal processing protease
MTPDTTQAKPKKDLPEFHTAMGRVVYGGGGIVPDLEIEEVRLPRIVQDLESKQLFFKFAVKYAAKHKDPPPDYAVSGSMRGDFDSYLKAEKFEYQPDSLAAAQRWVDTGLRRELARRYAGDEEAYRIGLEDDDQVKAAAALIDRAPTLPQLLALTSELSKAKAVTAAGQAIVR